MARWSYRVDMRSWLIIGVLAFVASCANPGPSEAERQTVPQPTITSSTQIATPVAINPPIKTIFPAPIEPMIFEPREHPLRIEGDRFVDRLTGEEFVIRGTNYCLIVETPSGLEDRFFSPEYFDRVRVQDDFTQLVAAGYNTVRLFLDTCSGGSACITNITGLNSSYVDVIAEVMRVARMTGMMLLLTSNDLPDGGGYGAIADRDNSSVFGGYRNSFYLTSSGTEAVVAYWGDLMEALGERNAAFDAVLGWSVLNEQWMFTDQPPLSLTSGIVTTATGTYDMADDGEKAAMVADGVRSYLSAVAAVIKEHHPSALVTSGFFAPQFPHETSIGGTWYVDTASLVADSPLDFFDFHLYLDEDITVEQASENFGITAAKPVVMREYGVFKSRAPDPASLAWRIQRFVAESCIHGWDGWIYWGFLPAPLEIGDATWALTEGGDRLLIDLSPNAWPDPCSPTLANPNLAAGAVVTASQSLPDEPPSNVVDASPAQWGASAGPDQWVEIGSRP